MGIDGFAYAFASIVLITYMSRLADSQHAASQYALLTSLCACGERARRVLGLRHRGDGLSAFFVGHLLIGLPVAALCLYVARRHGPMEG